MECSSFLFVMELWLHIAPLACTPHYQPLIIYKFTTFYRSRENNFLTHKRTRARFSGIAPLPTCHVLAVSPRGLFDKFPFLCDFHFSPAHARLIACCKVPLRLLRDACVRPKSAARPRERAWHCVSDTHASVFFFSRARGSFSSVTPPVYVPRRTSHWSKCQPSLWRWRSFRFGEGGGPPLLAASGETMGDQVPADAVCTNSWRHLNITHVLWSDTGPVFKIGKSFINCQVIKKCILTIQQKQFFSYP